jgi:hypothetical protein
MKVRILVILSLFAVVACNTRSDRQKNMSDGSAGVVSAKGKFAPTSNTKVEPCTNRSMELINPNLKKGDHFTIEVNEAAKGQESKRSLELEVLDVSNSLVRYASTLTENKSEAVKSEKKCEITSSSKISCDRDAEKEKMIYSCEIEDGETKNQSTAGNYTLPSGETVPVTQTVTVQTGNVTCRIKGEEVSKGMGTITKIVIQSKEVVEVPHEMANCYGSLVFLSKLAVLKDGTVAQKMTLDVLKAPLLKK